MNISIGSTDISVYFHLRTDTDGKSKTGLLYNSAGAIASYVRSRAVRANIPLVALSDADDPHSDGGFIEVDGVNTKGLYRLDVPDIAFSSGAQEVIIHIGFTGVYEESLRVELSTPPITVTAGGGTVTPAYAEEGETSQIVQGDVVNIARYLVGDYSTKRLFFGAKGSTGDTTYAVSVRECTNISYDSGTGLTSYTIPFVAADTKTSTPAVYKGETEVRDADGVSNPVTGDRFDLDVIGEIVT